MTPGEKACDELKVSLKDYFESKLDEVARRLVSLNDLHKYMGEDRAKFVSRDLHDKLERDLRTTETRIEALKNRLIGLSFAIGAFDTLIIAILIYHINK